MIECTTGEERGMNRCGRSLGGLCLRAVIVIGAGWVSMGAHAQEAVSAAPPSDEAACAPSVREALAESAEFGVAQDLVVIRDPEQGVGTPASIFDLSCLDDLFDYTPFNIHYDPARAMAELLGLAERYVCRRAHDAYRSSLGRRLDARVYTSRIPRLPGLDIDPAPGNILDDVDDVGGGDDGAGAQLERILGTGE